MTTPRADEALAEVRRLDEARSQGEWNTQTFEYEDHTEAAMRFLERLKHSESRALVYVRLENPSREIGTLGNGPRGPANAAYIAASTHPTTGWRATAEKAARLEEALWEIALCGPDGTNVRMRAAAMRALGITAKDLQARRKALGGES